ncbi:MAG TPA: Rrf2 family transcriptional regulator [Thermodesulfobacteriota bacterium]|nr:Rrf2 family transcriptional regulator [Thermodesulfobacteriota bacterium]
MFRLSRAAEYAIRGVLYLSGKSDQVTTDIEEIAKATDVPSAYLAKLFQTLGKKGFVRSVRGPEGGFVLLKSPEEISILEIIEALEGPIFLNDCLIREGQCPQDKVCPVHDTWKEAQDVFLDYLRNCNFKQLAVSGRKKRRHAGKPPPGKKKAGGT